jgi:hypothetical protein
MSSTIKLELKVGTGLEADQADTREVFSGTVDQTIGSTLSDDKWRRKLPGQKLEDLYFALHVSEGHAEDILTEICDYNQSAKSTEGDKSSSPKPMSPIEFINRLRSRYVNRMPSVAEGKVIYGVKLPSGRLQFRCSKEVTHRQRTDY